MGPAIFPKAGGGVAAPLRAAVRLVKEGGADMLKLDGAAEFPEAVRALTRAGIPVFAQFGLTPQTALKYGVPYSAQASAGAQAPPEMTAKLGAAAKLLEEAGAPPPRLHQFRAGGRRGGRTSCRDPGPGRLGRRAMARRAGAFGAHGHRLRG